MALLNWDSKYSVGVESMDKQHTVLFNMVNELHAAMMKGQAHLVTGPLLMKLVDYTKNHFATEESKMASAGYSGLTEHRLKHRELIKQVETFVSRYDRGEVTLNVQLLTFLRDWLTTHIQQEDRGYGPCLTQRGIR